MYASMAALGGQRVVLFGGVDNLGHYLNDTWTFDGTTWAQVSVANPPPSRDAASMAALGGQQVVLFGGFGTGGALDDTWTFARTTWTQVSVSGPPPAREGASMTPLQ
jgi:hypothetical protein